MPTRPIPHKVRNAMFRGDRDALSRFGHHGAQARVANAVRAMHKEQREEAQRVAKESAIAAEKERQQKMGID